MAIDWIFWAGLAAFAVAIHYLCFRPEASAAAKSAIAAHLEASGEAPIAIRRRWLTREAITLSLSNVAQIYEVTVAPGEGAAEARLYAYDPLGFLVFRTNGLKEYSSGSWNDLPGLTG